MKNNPATDCTSIFAACMEAITFILKMDPRPDGIISSNDSSAVVYIHELKMAGIRIPEQNRRRRF